MEIECTIRRAGGTHVDMPDGHSTVQYHFAPRDDGAHTCEVPDGGHADRFLAILEGYRVARPLVEPPQEEDGDISGIHIKRLRGRGDRWAVYDGDKCLTEGAETNAEALARVAALVEQRKAQSEPV